MVLLPEQTVCQWTCHLRNFSKITSSTTISQLFVLLCISLLMTASANGESKVIGSPLPIVAMAGDDIILPCHLEPPSDVVAMTVEWSRPDLGLKRKHGDLNRKYVHVHRDGREMDSTKNPVYSRRTALFLDQLKVGNVSLKISNVSASDQGTYRCFIPRLKSQGKESVVQLIVDVSRIHVSGNVLADEQINDVNHTERWMEDGSMQATPLNSNTRLRAVVSLPFLFVVAVAVGAAHFIQRSKVKEVEVSPSQGQLVCII